MWWLVRIFSTKHYVHIYMENGRSLLFIEPRFLLFSGLYQEVLLPIEFSVWHYYRQRRTKTYHSVDVFVTRSWDLLMKNLMYVIDQTQVSICEDFGFNSGIYYMYINRFIQLFLNPLFLRDYTKSIYLITGMAVTWYYKHRDNILFAYIFGLKKKVKIYFQNLILFSVANNIIIEIMWLEINKLLHKHCT